MCWPCYILAFPVMRRPSIRPVKSICSGSSRAERDPVALEPGVGHGQRLTCLLQRDCDLLIALLDPQAQKTVIDLERPEYRRPARE